MGSLSLVVLDIVTILRIGGARTWAQGSVSKSNPLYFSIQETT